MWVFLKVWGEKEYRRVWGKKYAIFYRHLDAQKNVFVSQIELSCGDCWAKYRIHFGHGSLGTLSSVSMCFLDTGSVGPEADAYKIRYKVEVNTGMRNHTNLTKCFPLMQISKDIRLCQPTARTTEGLRRGLNFINFTVNPLWVNVGWHTSPFALMGYLGWLQFCFVVLWKQYWLNVWGGGFVSWRHPLQWLCCASFLCGSENTEGTGQGQEGWSSVFQVAGPLGKWLSNRHQIRLGAREKHRFLGLTPETLVLSRGGETRGWAQKPAFWKKSSEPSLYANVLEPVIQASERSQAP